jgi:hypothetical protein
MPKNRDYTGLLRTPPSMAWLIRERAKLKGMIERRQKQLEDLPREIVAIQARLDALDAVIPLHEVKVDPQVIKGTKPKKKSLLPYGVLTRVIYRVLREAGGQPCFSSQIALEVMKEAGIPINHANKVLVTSRVGHRLGNMARQGRVVRHHGTAAGLYNEGAWSLPKQGWAQDDEDDQEPFLKAA